MKLVQRKNAKMVFTQRAPISPQKQVSATTNFIKKNKEFGGRNDKRRGAKGSDVVKFVNPFEELAKQSSQESYGVFMVERNILKNRRQAVEQKLIKSL